MKFELKNYYLIIIFLYSTGLVAALSLDDQGPVASGGGPGYSFGLGPSSSSVSPYNKPVPITPVKTSNAPIVGSAQQQTAYFNIFLQTLIGSDSLQSEDIDASAQSFRNLLLQMFQYYWQFSPATAQKGALNMAPPSSINEALSGNQGNYFLNAFESSAYPMMVISEIKKVLLQFLSGRFKQLDTHFYSSQTANNFISFTPNEAGTYTGEFFQVEQVWQMMIGICNSAIDKASGANNSTTITQIKNKLQALLESYETQKNQMLLNWFFNLLNDLALKYNETNFELKNYSYQVIPQVEVLNNYSKTIERALDQIVQSGGVIKFGPYIYDSSAKIKTKPSNLKNSNSKAIRAPQTFNDSADFISAVNSFINSKLQIIAAFTGKVALEKAVKLAEGKVLPKTIVQGDPLTGNYTQVAAFGTYGTSEPAGGLDQFTPITTQNMVNFAQFTPLQNQFQALSGSLENVMRAFGFSINNTIIWQQLEEGSALEELPLAPIGDNPETVQKEKLKDFIAAQQQKDFVKAARQKTINQSDSVDSDNTASRICETLILAAQGFAVANECATQANQLLWAKAYQQKAEYIIGALTYFKNAVINYQKAQNAPLFVLGATDKTQGDYFLIAQDFFQKAGQALGLLQYPELVVYAQQLAAQVGIRAYQSTTQGYVNYYKKWFTDYIGIAQEIPTLGQINSTYNNTPIMEYQNYLDTMFEYFSTMLDQAIQSYDSEMSFYYSINQVNNNTNQQSLAELQASIEVFSNFRKALNGIYRCQTNKNGVKECLGSLKTDNLDQCLVDASLTQDNTVCLGADNYIESAVKGDLTDVISWVTFATQKYLIAQPYFSKIDELFKQYQSSLENYTQIKDFFVDPAGKVISFSEFFYLHQAHLYMTIGQLLQYGQNWQRETIRDLSPVCLTLYLWSRALYSQGGFTKQAAGIDKIITDIIKQYPNEGKAFSDQAQIVAAQALKAKNVEMIKPLLEQVLLYYSTAYELRDFSAVGDYLNFIESFEQWFEKNGDTSQFSAILKISIYYSGYLFALKASDKRAEEFLKVSQEALESVYKKQSELMAESSVNINKTLSEDEYEAIENSLVSLVTLSDEAESLELFLQLYIQMLDVPFAKKLDWKKPITGLNKRLGDFYIKSGDKFLAAAEKSFAKGETFGEVATEAFQKIIKYYQKAATQYALANDQENFAKTQTAITNTVAFKLYSSILPVYHFNLKGVSVNDTSSDSGNSTLIPRPQCKNEVTIKTAMDKYTIDIPLFLMTYTESLIPEKFNSIAASLVNKTDPGAIKQIADKIVIPLYQLTLEEQANGTTDVSPYVAEFKAQINRMISSGVTACGKQLKATFEIEKQVTSDGIGHEVTEYFLKQYNTPLTPLPRFQTELNTVFALYSEGPLKLYGKSTIPVNSDDQVLIPSNNPAGINLVKEALLNTYLAAAVPAGAKIAATQKSKAFTTLKNLTAAEKFKKQFSDNSQLYETIQNEYVNLLAIYEALEDFIDRFGQGKAIVNNLQAEAYLDWTQTLVTFLVGNPMSSTYKGFIKTISQYAQAVTQYASSLGQNGVQLMSEAQSLVVKALEDAGDLLSNQPDKKVTIPYPSQSDSYPQQIPNFSTFNQWRSAWSFYSIADSFLTSFLASNSNLSFPSLQSSLTNIRVKEALMVSTIAIYYLALYGYNAYEECKCTLTSAGQKIAKTATFQTLFMNPGSSSAPSSLNWNVTTVNTNNPQYPSYQYPVVGIYPEMTFTKYNNKYIRSCPATGYSYGLLTGPTGSLTTQLFQGVASIKKPTFQKIIIDGKANPGAVSMANFMEGAGGGDDDQAVNNAYTFMQGCLESALYYFEIATECLGKLAPTQASQKESATISQADINKTQQIATMFSSTPAFDLVLNKTGINNLPVIMVATDITENGGKETQFFEISQYLQAPTVKPSADNGYFQWASIALSDTSKIYLQTIQYWLSNAIAGPNMLTNYSTWLSLIPLLDGQKQQDEVELATSWISDLAFVTQALYQSDYLPGVSEKDALPMMINIIKNYGQDKFIEAQEYLG